MKQVRKGIAMVLLLALFVCNSLSVAAASLPPEPQASEPSAGQTAQPMEAPTPVPPIIETNQTTTIEASVSPAASYYVVIPDRVSLGTLPSQGDFSQFYTVRVAMPEKEGGLISVSSQDRVDLEQTENSASSLPCHNQFGTRRFTKSGTAEGELTILAQDIRAAKPGSYSGVLQFHIRYEQGNHQDPSNPGNQTDPTNPTPSVPPTEPPVDIPTAPIVPPSDSGNEGSGVTYYSATVSMRKDTDFNSLSMCNALFYRKTDIVCKGDTATMTLYVVNPVPKFAQEGTPLSKVSMNYRGKSYPAQLNSSSKISKHFDAAPGFIETAGNYSASPIVVQLPMQAIRDASGKAIRCSAYINAIMKQNVDFYVVLKDLVQTGSAPSNQPADSGGTENGAEGANGESATLKMGQGEKTYYESNVSMRRGDDFHTKSMCDALFYEKADIVYQGDVAELTVYVIDPVPKFADEGTPLSNVAFLYEGKNYAAVLHPDKQVQKHFNEAPGFIPEAGEYTVTPVSVVLPKTAIAASLDAKLMCSAYINTVMHTTQKFYVVLDDLKKTDKADDTQKETNPSPNPFDSEAPQSETSNPPEVLCITTKLFPQMLGYILFTSLILGGSFVLIRYRRNGKDVFRRET